MRTKHLPTIMGACAAMLAMQPMQQARAQGASRIAYEHRTLRVERVHKGFAGQAAPSKAAPAKPEQPRALAQAELPRAPEAAPSQPAERKVRIIPLYNLPKPD